MDNLAGSQSPVADVAALVFGRYGKQFIFLILVVTVVSSIHADFLYMPRILFALARDGLLPQSLASVNSAGTPALTLFLCPSRASAWHSPGRLNRWLPSHPLRRWLCACRASPH